MSVASSLSALSGCSSSDRAISGSLVIPPNPSTTPPIDYEDEESDSGTGELDNDSHKNNSKLLVFAQCTNKQRIIFHNFLFIYWASK